MFQELKIHYIYTKHQSSPPPLALNYKKTKMVL